MAINVNVQTNSEKTVNFMRYIGVANAKVLAINPDAEHLKILTGMEDPKVQPTVFETNMPDGKKVIVSKIDVWFGVQKLDGNVINLKGQFSIRKQGWMSQSGKIHVIDRFGRTAWVTKDQLKNHEIPVYQNGPAALDPDYRICYRGEDELTAFVKYWCHIGNPTIWDDTLKKSLPMTDPERLKNCECRFDESELNQFWKGDYTPLLNILQAAANNELKVTVGVTHYMAKIKDAQGNVTGEQKKFLNQVWTDANAFASVKSRTFNNIVKAILAEQQRGEASKWILSVSDIAEWNPSPSVPQVPQPAEEELSFETQQANVSNGDVSDLPF